MSDENVPGLKYNVSGLPIPDFIASTWPGVTGVVFYNDENIEVGRTLDGKRFVERWRILEDSRTFQIISREQIALQFRPHRGALADSMREVRYFDNRDEFMRYLAHESSAPASIAIEPYGLPGKPGGNDERIGWHNVHIVKDSLGVIGFCAMSDGSNP